MPPQNTSDGFNDDMVALQTVQSNYDCHVVRLSALLKSDSQKIRLHLLFLDPRNLQRWFCPWWTMRSPGARMHRSERKLCNSAPHIQKCTDEKYRFAGKEPLKAHESMKAHWQRNIISNTSVSPTKANFLSELNTLLFCTYIIGHSMYWWFRIPHVLLKQKKWTAIFDWVLDTIIRTELIDVTDVPPHPRSVAVLRGGPSNKIQAPRPFTKKEINTGPGPKSEWSPRRKHHVGRRAALPTSLCHVTAGSCKFVGHHGVQKNAGECRRLIGWEIWNLARKHNHSLDCQNATALLYGDLGGHLGLQKTSVRNSVHDDATCANSGKPQFIPFSLGNFEAVPPCTSQLSSECLPDLSEAWPNRNSCLQKWRSWKQSSALPMRARCN